MRRAPPRPPLPDLFVAQALRPCGVDEAGRGPLAGAVVAAAVILPPGPRLRGLRDSKVLSPARREALAERIRATAIAWAVGVATVEEIDRINILQASLLAMRRAVEALDPPADAALIDGNQLPRLAIPMQAIVDGDALEPAISAASVLAKTVRDGMMRTLHEQFPDYGFATHFGYPTPDHLRVLAERGPCEIHRRSFAPVAAALHAVRGPDR